MTPPVRGESTGLFKKLFADHYHETTMSPQDAANSRPELVLDELDEKLDAFNALRKSDSKAADRILEQVGATDEVDRQIVLELASKRPLGHPDKFRSAHAGAMRALEVLDRNGSRGVKVRSLGPFTPIAAYLVQQVVHFIVKSHLRNVLNNITNLYNRREAACLPGAAERRDLSVARVHAERVGPGYRGNPLGFPTFLLGGAFLSTVVGGLQGLIVGFIDSVFGQVVLVAILFGVLVGMSWAVLKGAAIARRRIKLTVEQPLEALYQTVGRCGSPPGDQARIFALLAMVLLAVTWIVVPIALGVSLFFGQ